MTKSSSFLKHAAVYGAGNLLVSAAGFILLPLYVRCLSEGEYGILDYLNRLGEVVLLCLLIKGLRQALLAFHNQAKTDTERRAVIGSALTILILFLGGGGLLVWSFADPIAERFKLGSPDLVRLAVAAIFLESFAMLLLGLAQARVESRFFTIVNLAMFLLRVLLCVALVTVLGWKVEGVLLANAVAPGLFGVWLLVRELRRGLRIDGKQLRAMFWFALPFVPGGLAAFFLNSGDRVILKEYVSDADLGAYALGYKLALVVQLLTRRPLYQVWSAQMYDAADEPDAPQVFGKMFTRILMAYTGVGLALCLVPGEVVYVLSGGGYAEAVPIVAPVVLAYLFLSAADLMDAGFYITRRTALKTPITFASAAVTLGCYALLIPGRGIQGAAEATLLGFIFNAWLTWLVARCVLEVRYEWGRVAGMLAWALLVWGVGWLLPADLWLLPLKALLWFAWPVLLWLTVLSEEEKDWARALLARRRRSTAREPAAPGKGERPEPVLSAGREE